MNILKCPICGAKLINKQLCPYCKITDDQIINASNKKVKEYRKSGNTDLIHFTNVLPNDVIRWKLVLYTILFGWLGVNYFYINRPYRATYSMVSSIGSTFILIFGWIVDIHTKVGRITYNIIYELLFYMMAINVVLWVTNIVSAIFKKFKVPVVLAEKEK